MKRIDPRAVGALALVASLAACVAPPPGPTIPVAPGPGKSFDAFAADQNYCAQYAASQTAPGAYAANNQAVGNAVIGTALGAGLGAAIGAAAGNAGAGAAIGAASGAGLGTVAGANNSAYAQMSLQQQYDVMYGGCMRAHGNQVPGFGPPPGAPPYAGRRLRPAAGIQSAAAGLRPTAGLQSAAAGISAVLITPCASKSVPRHLLRAGLAVVGQKNLSKPPPPSHGAAPYDRLLVGIKMADHWLHPRGSADFVPLLDQTRLHTGGCGVEQ